MRSKPARFSLHFLLWLLLSGCAQAAVVAPTPVTVTIAGSTEMRPVLTELTIAYSQRHPNVLFSLRGGGSILGEVWLEKGQVDLAASTSFPTDEATPAQSMRVPIGLDGVAVIVHPSNPVQALTLAQLQNLYSGQALDWQDVGGEAGEIALVSREDGSATRLLFEERVMGEERVTLTAVVMPTSEDVVRFVARYPQAIGYVSRAYVLAGGPLAEEMPPVRVVALEGRTPTQADIVNQSYYLTRPLFLLRRTADVARLQPFIDFVLSPAGQEIVDRYHVRIR